MFRNRSFRTKLALAIAPPLVVLIALVATIVFPRLDAASEAAHKRAQATLATGGAQARDQLQVERDATIQSIASRGAAPVDLAAVRTRTNARRDALRALMANFTTRSEQERTALARTERALSDLDAVRSQIDTATVGPLQVFERYELLIHEHVSINEMIVTGSSDTDLLLRATANLDYIRYKNAIARANTFIGLRVEAGTLSQTDLLQVNADLAVAEQFRSQFLQLGSPAAIQAEQSATTSETIRDTLAKRDEIMLAGSRNRTPQISPAAWWDATENQLVAMDAVEARTFADFTDSARQKERDARSDTTLYLAALSIGVLLAALTALAFARTLAARIAAVSNQAHHIASERLPEVLDALRNPTPEVLAQALPQVQADSTDEIGSLAASFNTVLRTSVETSIAHAERRSQTLTNILVNLGRRNQALIDRQLALVDSLEATQRDPDVLAGLFQLDHMITSLRRNAENLLVLASDSQARSWSAPVPMIDVVRGAVAEVEDMSRIVLELDLADNSMVSGRCAVDLSHLIAELVDNALAFSSPTTSVQLRAERTPLHFRVWVLDHGLGMTEAELASANERVGQPPDVDELSADRIGFQVIGRLAIRLGVSVRLQPNPGGGIAASVTVPAALLEPEPQLDQLLAAPRRPMALESADRERDAIAAAWAGLADEVGAAETVPQRGARTIDESERPTAVTQPASVDLQLAARPTWLDEAPSAPGEPTTVEVPVTAEEPIPQPAADPITAGGLQRRVPGQAFVGDAKAQQFDSGQFRRLPMPGARANNARRVDVPDGVAAHEPDGVAAHDADHAGEMIDRDTADDLTHDIAKQRLRAMTGLQAGAWRARDEDPTDGS